MSKQYKAVIDDLSTYLGKLRKEIPEVMNGFGSLAKAAGSEGVLDKKTKELIAIALGVAARCDGCIGFHAQALVKLGASRQELLEVLGMAIYMGGGPSLMYAAETLKAFEEFSSEINPIP